MHSPPQINHFQWKEAGLWIVKVAVLAGSLFYIFLALQNSSFTGFSYKELVSEKFLLLVGLVLVLVPINWYLEILKWKISVKPITTLSDLQATWSVLKGLSLNWIIPFTLGDFIGRSIGLPKTKMTVRVLFVNRLVSLWTTIFFGAIGLAFWWPDYQIYSWVLLSGLLFTMGVASFKDSLYTTSDKVSILALTIIRYLVFSIQFILLLNYFAPEIPLRLITFGISIVFLIRTIAPSVLGALGVREAAVLFVFLPYAHETTDLLMASLFLWLFNIVLPSILGLVPIVKYKLNWSA